MLSNPTIYNFFDTKGSKLNNNKSLLSIDLSLHQHCVSSPSLSLSLSSHKASPQALPALTAISTTSISPLGSPVATTSKQDTTLPKTNLSRPSQISSFFTKPIKNKRSEEPN